MPIPFLNHLLPFGRRSEILAVEYLHSIGYRVTASGFRGRNGEIDVIAWDGDILVFVEVKSRRADDPPEDAVTLRKQRRIIRTAKSYMARLRLHDTTFRFDIVAVTENHGRPEFHLLRNAFRS